MLHVDRRKERDELRWIKSQPSVAGSIRQLAQDLINRRRQRNGSKWGRCGEVGRHESLGSEASTAATSAADIGLVVLHALARSTLQRRLCALELLAGGPIVPEARAG